MSIARALLSCRNARALSCCDAEQAETPSSAAMLVPAGQSLSVFWADHAKPSQICVRTETGGGDWSAVLAPEMANNTTLAIEGASGSAGEILCRVDCQASKVRKTSSWPRGWANFSLF